MKRRNLDNHSPFHKTGHTSKGIKTPGAGTPGVFSSIVLFIIFYSQNIFLFLLTFFLLFFFPLCYGLQIV